ncbi:MAG: hypothetical protein NT025_09565 [bacterium]|nr:hypothetical protein [bacterium]
MSRQAKTNIYAITLVVLCIILATLLLNCSNENTTKASPQQKKASHELIADLTQTGLITKVDSCRGDIFVDPLIWSATSYEHKKMLATAAMIHFEDQGYLPVVHFRDNYTGKELGSAIWGWGFKSKE